jgi:hypothetical protein
MKTFKSHFLAVLILSIVLLFSVTSYAQVGNFQGIRLNDGSVIYGKVLQVNVEKVTVEDKDGKISVYNFNDVQSFIKEGQDEAAPAVLKETAEGKPEVKATSIAPLARHSFEIGPELSYIKYQEPGVMEQKGMMYGIGAAYTYRNGVIIKIAGRYSYGQVDYQNSGTLNNINDSIFEIRALGGYDFKISSSFTMTPFFGFAYRYLRDDMAGRISSTGAAGYLREANYYYSPIGIEAVNVFDQGWSTGVILEYDLFWKGVQKSYLSGIVGGGYNDITNNQNSGYGLRGSLFIKKQMERVSFTIEPFVRYWNIDKSDDQIITRFGIPWSIGWEPKNNSTEIGVMFMIGF